MFPPPPRKRYGAGLGPHRVNVRRLRSQKSLKARRSARAAQQGRKRGIPRTFEHLIREVDEVVKSTPGAVSHPDDEIFLQQLAQLNVAHTFRTELAAARDLVARSAEQALALKEAREEGIAREKEAMERRLERQRMEAELEKQRQRMARLEKQHRAAMRYQAQNAHRLFKERIQANRPAAPQQRWAEGPAGAIARYEDKWDFLKNEHCAVMEPIQFSQVPWPILAGITCPDQIIYSAVEEFLFHPLRVAKSPKDRLKAEMLRWHPDKFDARVLGKIMVDQVDAVKDASGRVVRILTQMMMKLEAE